MTAELEAQTAKKESLLNEKIPASTTELEEKTASEASLSAEVETITTQHADKTTMKGEKEVLMENLKVPLRSFPQQPWLTLRVVSFDPSLLSLAPIWCYFRRRASRTKIRSKSWKIRSQR